MTPALRLTSIQMLNTHVGVVLAIKDMSMWWVCERTKNFGWRVKSVLVARFNQVHHLRLAMCRVCQAPQAPREAAPDVPRRRGRLRLALTPARSARQTRDTRSHSRQIKPLVFVTSDTPEKTAGRAPRPACRLTRRCLALPPASTATLARLRPPDPRLRQLA